MAGFYETVFILQFLIVLGIMLFKIYNLFKGATLYGIKEMFVLFVVFLMAYGIGFFTFLVNTDEIILTVLFSFESYFILAHVGIMVIEILMAFSNNYKQPLKNRGL